MFYNKNERGLEENLKRVVVLRRLQRCGIWRALRKILQAVLKAFKNIRRGQFWIGTISFYIIFQDIFYLKLRLTLRLCIIDIELSNFLTF